MTAWVEGVMARWVRILGAGGRESTPLDEGVRLISEVGDEVGRSAWFRTPKRRAKEASTAAAVGTTLSRYVIAGLISSDLLLDRLCAATGRTREEALQDLAGDYAQRLRDEQLRILRLEFTDSCLPLLGADSESAYGQLGSRIEEVLRLTERQVEELLKNARAQADETRPCPNCGAG